MSNITTPASGDLNVNISSLFNDAANAINAGIRMGNAFANITGGDTSTQQVCDPNSRITNQNPYGNNPYAQAPVYQSANYGYGYGNIGGTYSMNDYQNGVYPGISNPNYGM